MKLTFVIALLIAVALTGPAVAAEHTKDAPATVRKAVTSGKAVLLDVREQDEWEDGHLKDARLLPLSKIEAGVSAAELKAIIPAGSAVYLHCASGRRVLKAAGTLKKHGYDVRPLKQGYKVLLDAGFPKATK